jgi:chemotaxis protein MotD
MISNAVTNMPASSGAVRSEHSGRTSGEADNAFRDALDKSAKADAEASGKETETTETKPRPAYADARWRNILEKAPEEPSAEGDAEADATDGQLVKDAKGRMKDPAMDAAGEQLLDDTGSKQDGDGKANGHADDAAVKAAAHQAVPDVGKTAKAANASAAQGIARADERASEKARLPAIAASADDGAADAGETATARQSSEMPKVNPAPAATAERAGQNNPAGLNKSEVGAIQPAASGSPERGPLAGASAASDQPAGMTDGQHRRAASGVRIMAGETQIEPRRVAGEFASASVRSSVEQAGAAVKTTGSVDILPGSADAPVSRQVAEAVVREMEELAPSRLSLNGSTAPGGRTVKTMRLQLHPAELGPVNIRMQSVDGELRVTIQAESDQTTRMLHNDADAIRSALRAAGIGGADVVVAGNRNDSAQSQNFNAQHRDPSGQQMDAQENRQNGSNESRQSSRESSPNDSAYTQTRGGGAGDGGTNRDSRIVI